MSDPVVKEWRPAEGCKSCKQAARLFHEHTKIAARTNSLAVNRIRELEAEVAELRDANKGLAKRLTYEDGWTRNDELQQRAEAAEAKVESIRAMATDALVSNDALGNRVRGLLLLEPSEVSDA